MADHQEQQPCEANTDNSWAILPGSVEQTHSDRPFRKHSKTHWKQTPMNHTYTHKEQFKNTQNGMHKWHTTRKHDNKSPR